MVGIDEVGRGAWAGPLLVVAARQITSLPKDCADSKSLSPRKRQQIYQLLRKSCKIGEGWVSPIEIDDLGLAQALKLGYARALDELKVSDSVQIIVDGSINYAPSRFGQVTTLVKADESVPIVSAASIWAKVKRDRFMKQLAKRHPHFGLEKHVGYGTANHRMALERHGAVAGLHRFSYKPISRQNSQS